MKRDVNGKSATRAVNWDNLEGWFPTPQGMWIVRVRYKAANNKMMRKTLSQHPSEEEAKMVFNEYQQEHGQHTQAPQTP